MLRTAGILVVGGACGWFASRLGLPLPWLLGPLLATAAAALLGVPLAVPPIQRKVGQGIAAIAIGLSFSPAVAEHLLGYTEVMLLAATASVATAMLTAYITSRLCGISFDTAYFSSLPGGVAEMSVLAERYGGEVALVALAQSLRIVLVVLTVPVAIVAISGGRDLSVLGAPAVPPNVLALLVMLATGAVIGIVLDRLKVMNAWFLGGLIVGATIALGEIPASSVPVELIDVAQVLIGTSLGARIDRRVLIRLRHFLPATILGTVTLIAFNVAMALLLALWTGLDVPALVLATAPGGVAEMSITAKALHLAVPMVTAFHLVRVLMIILLSAPIYRGTAWVRARFAGRQPAE